MALILITSLDDFKIEIVKCRLFVTLVELHPGAALEIERRLEKEPARYPMRRTEIRNVFVDHQKTEAFLALFRDTVPRFAVFAQVPNAAFNGVYSEDGTNFKHFNVKQLQVSAGNMEIPHVPLEMDWLKDHIIRAYEHLHRTLGYSGRHIDCGINRKMFADGFTYFPFNLTTTLEDIDGFELMRQGTTFLNIKYDTTIKVPEGGIMIVYMGIYDSVMYIDKTRTIRTDLSV